MFSFQGTIQNLQEIQWNPNLSVETSVKLLIFLYIKKEWWARTRFPAGKPRRLQQSAGLLPRAAFRVHFGVFAFRTQSSRSWLLFSFLLRVVGQNGLEPSTSRLSVVCSSQLSYWPIWWRLAGSNRWPPACKAGALPAELNPHLFTVSQDTSYYVPSKLNNASMN